MVNISSSLFLLTVELATDPQVKTDNIKQTEQLNDKQKKEETAQPNHSKDSLL